jgi:putative PIN family toxin of toxin-antitoxin system
MATLSLQLLDHHSITCDMKFVLDTDVVVSALRSPTGASAELVRLSQEHRFAIAISVPLVLEYEGKAMSEEHLAAGGLTRNQALTVIDGLVAVGEQTNIYYTYRPSTRDPDDEMVLETAINAAADAIVTFNIKDFGPAPRQFGILCLRPAEALEKVR